MTEDTLVSPRVHTAFMRGAVWLADRSIAALRISLGLVFLGFGALKFIPGASPAEELAVRTVETLTLGIVSGQAALFMTATAETFIGLTLVSRKFIRAGLVVLAASMVGSCRLWCSSSTTCSPVDPPSKPSTSSRTSS